MVAPGAYDALNLPPAVVKETDADIPRAVWSSWIPGDGSPRAVRRELTPTERGALERRVAELEPALVGYVRPDEDDEVAMSLGDMFGGFTSMRATGADALSKIASAMKVLEPYPTWAILLACQKIRTEGYVVRDGDGSHVERHWPPSDGEIIAEVKEMVRLRTDALKAARALLSAPVER